MPKLGSDMLLFLENALQNDLYPNLRMYDPEQSIFAVEHLHRRNENWNADYFRLYEDYYKLKRPNETLPKSEKVKRLLDSALNHKKGKYVRFVGKDEKLYLYQIIGNYGRDISGSPAIPMTDYPVLTFESEPFEESPVSSPSDYSSCFSNAGSPSSDGVDVPNLETDHMQDDIAENIQNVLNLETSDGLCGNLEDLGLLEEFLCFDGEDAQNVLPETFCSPKLEPWSVNNQSVVPQATLETAHENDETSMFSSNVDVGLIKEEQKIQQTQFIQSGDEGNALRDLPKAEIFRADPVGGTQMFTVEKLQTNKYRYTFQGVCETPLNDPVFLYLSQLSCSA